MSVPRLRFKEFDEDWNLIKLGEHSSIKGRLGWKSLKQEEYTVDGPYMVAGRHIKNGNIDWESVDHIPQWRYEESPDIMLDVGDLIFTKDGSTLGNPALIKNLPGESTINSTMMLVRSNSNIDSKFLYQILLGPQFKKLIHLKVSGSGIPHLFQADMKEFYFLAPLIKEQKKISNFLEIIDNKIKLQQEKIELLKQQQEMLIKQIFNQELRFPGFNEPWKLYKLGDLGTVEMNKRIFKEQTNVQGGIPFYKIGTFGGKPDAFITRELFDEYKEKYSYPNFGDILISASGSIGKIVEYNGEDAYFQDSNIVWLNHNGKIDNRFLKHFYSIVEWKGLEGSTIKRLYNKNILNTGITLPSIEEQKRIGDFLDKYDFSVRLQEQKLNTLQEQKQAFMQQMFI